MKVGRHTGTQHMGIAKPGLAVLAVGVGMLGILFLGSCTKPAPGGTASNLSSSREAEAKSTGLSVVGGEPVVYDAGEGRRITARYYSLSDNSLSFVKLELPDGSAITLPNLASGSGARYSDDLNLVWWTKGDGAFAEKRDDSGQWKSLYPDCKEIPAKASP